MWFCDFAGSSALGPYGGRVGLHILSSFVQCPPIRDASVLGPLRPKRIAFVAPGGGDRAVLSLRGVSARLARVEALVEGSQQRWSYTTAAC